MYGFKDTLHDGKIHTHKVRHMWSTYCTTNVRTVGKEDPWAAGAVKCNLYLDVCVMNADQMLATVANDPHSFVFVKDG